jgi:Protein of unknown function (DUF1552)
MKKETLTMSAKTNTATTHSPFVSRRRFLRGTGGVTLGLPLLDVFSRNLKAQAAEPGYAVFVGEMNGVQQSPGFGPEPERFWPTQTGAMTTASLGADTGRAMSVLAPYADKLAPIRGVAFSFDGNGCGHSGGGNQVLTAHKVSPDLDKNKSLAMGESVDHFISKTLTQREPLALYAGPKYGYINDHISHRGTKDVIVGENNPWIAYSKIVGMTGGDAAAQKLVATRRKSINDLVRTEVKELLGRKDLSADDRTRLDLHFSAIREIELSLVTEFTPAKIAELKSVDGQHRTDPNRLKVVGLQQDLIVFALASGHSRVAFLQVGDGTDGVVYTVDGAAVPNFHHISHRINSDGAEGTPIDGADLMHHKIDRIRLTSFGNLLGKMAATKTPTGSLLDLGYAVWTNQIADGYHQYKNVPFIVAGKAGGYLKTGQFISVTKVVNNKLLNTLANAAGVRKASGALIDDLGDPSNPKGTMPELMA